MDFLQDNTFFDSQNVNILSGTSDADQIFGLEGNDFIFGAESGDQLFGNLGLDTVVGHQGDDEIFGGAEADLIFGGRGNDTVSGDDGSDTIHGDRGTDILIGGEGEDVFVLSLGTGNFTVETTNLIIDFEVGEDQIELLDGLIFADLSFEETPAGDTLIRDIESGEMLALLQGVSSSALTEESFVGIIPPELLEPIITFSLANDTGLDDQDNITSDPTLTGIVSNSAEIAELEIAIDGEFVSIDPEIAEDGTFTLSQTQLEQALNISFAENEIYTVQLRTVDTSGLRSNIVELTFTLALDGEPPEQEFEFFLPEIDFLPPFVSASLANDTGISDSDGITTDATITGTATDNAGIAQLEVSIGGGFVPVSTNIAGDGTFTLTQAQLESALNTNLTEGANTVSVRAIDTSGLRSPIAQVNFTLISDVTPPEVTPPGVDTQEPIDGEVISIPDSVEDLPTNLIENDDFDDPFETELIDVPEDPGNTIAEAYEISVISQTVVYNEQVSADDPVDYYTFNIENDQSFDLFLDSLSQDVDVYLLDVNQEIIARSENIGITAELITVPLSAGTYYIQVQSFDSQTTTYDLNILFPSRTPEIETSVDSLVRYDFVYYSNGINTQSDYYTGYVYAEAGAFTAGELYDFSSESGSYYIANVSSAPTNAIVDQVFINNYYDIDVNFSSAVSYSSYYSSISQASGFFGLGSEYDFIEFEGIFFGFGLQFITIPNVDTQKPIVTASLANDTGEDDSDGITSDATITGTATSNTGIAQLEVSIGGGFVPVSTNIAADGTFTLTQEELETAFNTDFVDGAYTVSVQAVDTSSLVSETVELSFTLDTTPPTISAQLANDTGDDNTDGITSDPTITGTVSDANEIVALRAGSEGNLINISSQLEADGSFEVEQLQIEASLGESLVENTSYTLQLEAEDRSGLVTQTTVSFTLEEVPDETNPIDEPPPPEEIEMIDDDDEIPPAIQPPEEREVIEEPGNEEAFEITVSSNPIIYSEQVSGDDLDDFYVFTVETAGNISLDLTGLSSDADLILFDSNANPIDLSNAIGITDESITRPLDAGTYFIVVTSFDQETTEYDLGVVFTSRVAPPPPPQQQNLVRYDFGYLYDGATLEDDFYLGYTYAEPGTFELNTFYDDFSGENEDGSNGLYFVFDDTGEVPSDAVLDEVYVLGYFDIDASDEDEDDPLDELYIPFYSANGLASGFEGLGSEYDFIALEDGTFDDFGFDFYEADGVEEIFSNTRFTRADYPANSLPDNMVNADLNNDGRDELIVANIDTIDSGFSILFNQGDGSFEFPIDFTTEFSSSGGTENPSLDVGDLDGDGNVDLITVNPETNEVSLYLGDGNGNLSAPGTIEVGDRPVISETADVDSDGNTDVVLINSEEFDFPFYTGDSLSVLFNRTNNSNVSLTAGEGVRDVVAADLDGDGDVDLATANELENTVSVLINFGNIIFSDPIKYDVGDRPFNIVASDLDGNGTVDLATTDFGSDTVSVLRNSGDGFFAPALTFTTNENPSTMSVADLDGDGDSDLVMRNSVFFEGGDSEGNSISLLLNNGDATFNEPLSFTVGESPVGLIVEDLDGNGLLDIATSNFDGQSVTVYLQS